MSSSYPPHVQLQEPLEDQNTQKDEVQVLEMVQNQDLENQQAKDQINEDGDVIRIMRNYGQAYPRNFGKIMSQEQQLVHIVTHHQNQSYDSYQYFFYQYQGHYSYLHMLFYHLQDIN